MAPPRIGNMYINLELCSEISVSRCSQRRFTIPNRRSAHFLSKRMISALGRGEDDESAPADLTISMCNCRDLARRRDRSRGKERDKVPVRLSRRMRLGRIYGQKDVQLYLSKGA